MKAIQPKIIIINNCNDCPYAQYGGLGVICHKLEEIGKYNVPYDMDDCPLKPMPEPIYVEVNEIEDLMHTEFSIENLSAKIRLDTDKIFSLGWNACLEEIEK